MDMMLRMREASRLLGVTAETLRNWERKGLIKPVRTLGNQRRYSNAEIQRILEGKNQAEVPR